LGDIVILKRELRQKGGQGAVMKPARTGLGRQLRLAAPARRPRRRVEGGQRRRQ